MTKDISNELFKELVEEIFKTEITFNLKIDEASYADQVLTVVTYFPKLDMYDKVRRTGLVDLDIVDLDKHIQMLARAVRMIYIRALEMRVSSFKGGLTMDRNNHEFKTRVKLAVYGAISSDDHGFSFNVNKFFVTLEEQGLEIVDSEDLMEWKDAAWAYADLC